MHTVTLKTPEAVSAVAAALTGPVTCQQNEDGTWSLSVPDAEAAQADTLAANPPQVAAPSAPVVSIPGNYLWAAIADLGWLGLVQSAIAASTKPLDVQYCNSTGKAETIFSTDAKWGRILTATAALGAAATPAVTGISLAAALSHGQAMIASGV